MDFKLELITEENFPSYLILFEKCFGENLVDSSYFTSKFETEFTGLRAMGYLAIDTSNGEVVGGFSFYPVLTNFQGEEKLIGQAGDLAVVKEYRGKGLFRLLHEAAIELCIKNEISFVFAYPNTASFPGFTKFGWEHHIFAFDLFKTIGFNPAIKAINRFLPGRFDRYRKRQIEKHRVKNLSDLSLDKAHSICWVDQESIEIKRTNEYLQYKVNLGAMVLQFKSGVAIVYNRYEEVRIGDVLGENPKAILKEVISFFNRLGCTHFSMKVSSEQISKELSKSKMFELKKGLPLAIKNLSNKPIDHKLFSYTGLDLDSFSIHYS